MKEKSGNIRSYQKNKGYESIPRDLLQNTALSLEAIGLLCHLQSYPDNWRLYKTELYTRFESSKRTAIDRIWKELVLNNYLLEFKKRDGKKYEYQYVYSLEPFSEKEKENIYVDYRNNGFMPNVDFQNLNKDSPKATTVNDYLNTKNDSLTTDSSETIKSENKPTDKVIPFIQEKEFIKPLTLSLLCAGIEEKDCAEIIEYIASLPKVDQQVSDLVNAQIRANEQESKTNGLTNYKAYFLTGLKQKLHNANLNVRESNITDPETVAPLPKVTLHNWLE